jgi:hypothetical protein
MFLSKDAEMHDKSILNRSLMLYDVISDNKLVLNTSYYLRYLLLVSITFISDIYKNCYRLQISAWSVQKHFKQIRTEMLLYAYSGKSIARI